MTNATRLPSRPTTTPRRLRDRIVELVGRGRFMIPQALRNVRSVTVEDGHAIVLMGDYSFEAQPGDTIELVPEVRNGFLVRGERVRLRLSPPSGA